jgi:hypothetical protein
LLKNTYEISNVFASKNFVILGTGTKNNDRSLDSKMFRGLNSKTWRVVK